MVTACNTGTNTVTNVSVTDAWANTDSLTIANPAVINDGLAQVFEVLDVSQTTEIPALARAVAISAVITDTGGVGGIIQCHPYEAYSAAKIIPMSLTQTTNSLYAPYVSVPLILQRFGMRVVSTGAGTMNRTINLVGYQVAVP